MSAPPITGKISWFGGPNDPTAGPTTASGAPVTRPGIAVYNQGTLGGWWMLKMPNGRLAVVQQTDIGPAPWTGRKFDFTSSSLSALGYTEGNFPTNGSVSGIYLGKGNQQIASNILGAATSLGANVPNIAGWLQKAANVQPGQIATSDAAGNTAGPFDLGAVNTSNTLSGSGNLISDVPGAIAGVWNSAVGDAKYAAVLVVILALGAFLMFKSLSSASNSGGSQSTKLVPVPV